MNTQTNTQAQNVTNMEVDALEALLAEAQLEAEAVEAQAAEMPEVEAPKAAEKPKKKKSKAKNVQAQAPAPVVIDGDMKEMLAKVTNEEKQAMAQRIRAQFDERAAFEKAKNANNDKIQSNLKNYGNKMTSLGLAGVLHAISVDPAFINREVTAGKRFNVYAIDKVNDILAALETGVMRNAINRAVMKSLFKFRAAGVAFTGIAATACASDKIKVDHAMQKLLVRHTVSAATAPTQTSSTMSALQTLGIVVNRGTTNQPVWELTDTPQTRHLEALLAA